MSPGDFKDLAQGVQAILLGMSALLGAVWVLLRFALTREQRRAVLELERIRIEAQRLRGISGDIAIKYVGAFAPYAVYVDVTLTNLGDRVRVFQTDDYPFRVSRATFIYGEVRYTEVARVQLEGASVMGKESDIFTSITLLPQTPRKCSFFCEVNESGSYLFSFLLPDGGPVAISPEDQTELQRTTLILEKYLDNTSGSLPWPFQLSQFYWIGAALRDSDLGDPAGDPRLP